LLLAALLAQSCRCSSSDPQITTGSGGSAEVKAGTGSAPVAAGPKTTLDITLPKVSGKPPVKTTGPVSKAVLDKLSAMEFPEFKREVSPFPNAVVIRQRAETKPKVSINIYVVPCDNDKNKCRPMKLDAWKADEAKIKEVALEQELRDRPDTIWEIAETSIGGVPAISVYQAAHFFGKDQRDNPVAAYSHAYTLHYNDGHNTLRVIATFSDNPRKSLEAMTKAIPRAFLEKAAVAFLDAYGQAWQ
jgi:hypothetical protein